MIGFDSNLLTNYYLARSGSAGATATGSSGSRKTVPTPPWDPKATSGRAAELVKKAMAGAKFVNVGAAQLDVPGASDDYRKLFALYQGLNTLYGLAEQSLGKGVSPLSLNRMQSVFARGLIEVAAYTDTLKLEKLRLARGEVASSLRSETGVRREKAEYITGPIHSGLSTDVVTAFQGPVVFNVNVKRGSTDIPVAIDLGEMGAQPRTMANVVNFINGKLEAAGVSTRFATAKLPNEPRTIQVGGKTVTLPVTADRWAWKIKGDTTEHLTFSAPATSGAVYLAQSAGKLPSVTEADKGAVDETQRQLLKFQTDNATVPAVSQEAGEANWVDGRVFSQTLSKEVSAVRATATGSDGSVYLLADVTGTTAKQGIQGTSDVALMKYDSAGKLVYSRTLGAADAASGYGLAVAADGKVAIVGSITGSIEGVVEGPINSADDSNKSDSFVTLFNADGEELWTERRGAREADEANEVAFGADGTVYVAGRTRSALPGATAMGGWDGYLAAYATQSTGQPRTLFTTQFGTAGDDRVGGLAVDGNRVIVGGVEGGAAVLRGFDVSLTTVTTTKTTLAGEMTTTIVTAVDGVPTNSQSSSFTTGGPDSTSSTIFTTAAAATASGVRDLGQLRGGEVAGVYLLGGQVIVAGTTHNGALDAGATTANFSAGSDAFVARLSSGLTAQAGDRIAYIGGDGDDAASAVTVAGGEVWIAGSTASTSLAGSAKLGARDGYLARVDVDTGVVGWSRRFTARDGVVAPTSIAVDQTGVSVLDQLGLPRGTIDYKDSELLTSATSLRAGDQFYVRSRDGARPTAITIAANETLTTLAAKVRRAAGYSAKVEVTKGGDFATLQIKVINDRSTVEIIAGKSGKDALESLGLKEGVVQMLGSDDERKTYGLHLSNDLLINTKDAAKAALDQLAKALGKIRTAYRDLELASRPKSAIPPDISGPVPAYLKDQLANYQAALARLGG